MGKKPLIAFVADHHSGGGYPGRQIDDSWYAVHQVCVWCEENLPEWLVLLGDNLDKQTNKSKAVVPLREQLDSLDPRVKIGFIQGNHDFVPRPDPPWLQGARCVHLDRHIIDVGCVTWMGLDYRPRDVLLPFLDALPGDVGGLMMHQGWAEFMRFDGVPQVSLADVPESVSLVATGDFHGGFYVKTGKGKGGQDVTLCNPGSTSVQSISEPPDKYFAVLWSDGTFSKVPLKGRRIVRSHHIRSSGDLDLFLGSIRGDLAELRAEDESHGVPKELWRPLLQVAYDYTVSGLRARVEKIVGQDAHLFWSENRPDAEERLKVRGAKLTEAATPLSLMHEAVDRKTDPLAAALLERVLRSPSRESVQATLHSWWQEQTEG